jgi:hypothetical protein
MLYEYTYSKSYQPFASKSNLTLNTCKLQAILRTDIKGIAAGFIRYIENDSAYLRS